MGLERGGLVGAVGLYSFLRTTRELLPADHLRQTRDRHVGPASGESECRVPRGIWYRARESSLRIATYMSWVTFHGDGLCSLLRRPMTRRPRNHALRFLHAIRSTELLGADEI